MPGYYYNNPYQNIPTYASPYMPQPSYSTAPMQQNIQYMYSVDGEMAARAWQPSAGVVIPPNTVIPLFDMDGKHVYFKTTDNAGRFNPIRKATVVFEDEVVNLPQNNSGMSGAASEPQTPEYATKNDMEYLKNELKELREMMARNNQNGSGNSGNSGNNNRGGNR